MSVSTSLACLSTQWHPQLSHRSTNAEVPPGDVVIKTSGAAFVVVHCAEEILYGGTETCHYVTYHKGLVAGTGTILLMISVVLLGNCQWTMQAAIGSAYIILNLLYWGVPLIAPQRTSWNMRRYKVDKRKKQEESWQQHIYPIPTAVEDGPTSRGHSGTLSKKRKR